MDKSEAVDIVEKRRYLRFLVRYTANVYFDGEVVSATVLDISEGGAGIIISRKLHFHDELFIKIKFRLEEAHRSHVQFKARIIWTDPAHINEMYVGGLEITEITHTDLKIFQQLLEELYVRDCIQTKYEKNRFLLQKD